MRLPYDEGEFLTGRRDPEHIRQALWHDDLKLMVITGGRTGCAYATANFSGAVAGFGVDAVDTTGAGDGFVAGLLQGILTEPDMLRDETRLRELCRFANAVGALATTERGAIPALPTRERVQEFLEQRQR
jgi:fructokinase